MNLPTLDEAVKNLVFQLQHYESDTFSASEHGVTQKQAEQMAANLICSKLFDMDGFPGDEIDGAEVGLAFDVIDSHD